MSKRPVTFERESAERIARVVREVESQRPGTGRPRRRQMKGPSKYGWLFQITAVDEGAGTCTVERYKDSGNLTTPELTEVNYDAENVPSVDDLGIVLRQGDGGMFFFPGGGGGQPVMIQPYRSNMSADNTGYTCRSIKADGTAGSRVDDVKRPYGIYISKYDIGFLGQDANGENVFIPANMRGEEEMPLRVEYRSDDPDAGDVGRIYWRSA